MILGISPSLVRIVAEDGGTGSGFILNARGDVITNSHVVGHFSTATIHLQDGRSFTGTVLGQDEYLDLALIRLQGGRGAFSVAVLGNSGRVSAGQDVLALGFQLSSDLGGSPTVTRGIVSAMRTDATGAVWIQTDAPINPGSSGGPLLDRSGRVVGVVTSRQDYDWQSGRNVEGVGFALAVNELKDRMDFLTTGGKALLPTPTPVPMPTRTPTPIPPNTGSWRTWDELRDEGYEGDEDGEPRVLLQGTGPYPSLYSTNLHVDCYSTSSGRLEIAVYLTKNSITDLFLPNPWADAYPVVYSIDGREGPLRQWQYQSDEDIEREIWFAPDGVADRIITALLRDPRKLAITVNPGESYANEYVFYTQGFGTAAKPVLDYCDWK